jgi:membrane protease YdiL (CAAX protease family)
MTMKKAVWDHRGRLRAGWRIALYASMVFVATWIAISIYGVIAHVHAPNQTEALPTGMTIAIYLSLLVAVSVPALVMLRFVDGSSGKALGFAFHDRVGIEALQGILQGTSMVVVIFIVEWVAGWIAADWSGLQPCSVVRSFGYSLAFFAAAAAFEETLLRGYAFQVLIQGIGKTGAVCLTSVFFGLFHLMNPNVGALAVFNSMLAGVWLSIAYIKTRSLWLPSSLHMFWNLTQGYIFGFPISGVPISESLMSISQYGEGWVTGGRYGPEGGVISSFVLILGTIYLLRSKKIKPSKGAVSVWR